MKWDGLSNQQLLATYCELMSELRTRSVVRSSNNPIADWTEGLVCHALGLKREIQSTAGYDARDDEGTRYQIKGRRLTPENSSTQLSAIRNLAQGPFDVLAAVVYKSDFSINYAALIPVAVVIERSRYRAHSNSHVFMFPSSVLSDDRVTDISEVLRDAALVF
jgi:hypothetical protein